MCEWDFVNFNNDLHLIDISHGFIKCAYIALCHHPVLDLFCVPEECLVSVVRSVIHYRNVVLQEEGSSEHLALLQCVCPGCLPFTAIEEKQIINMGFRPLLMSVYPSGDGQVT